VRPTPTHSPQMHPRKLTHPLCFADWNQQQLGLLKSIFDRKMDEAIQEGTRVVSGEQFLREEPLDDISDQCPGTEACDVSDSAEAGVEAHDASSP